MRLYTADEATNLIDRFSKVKLNANDQRMVMDYMEVMQIMSKAIEDFLEKYEEPKRSFFFGLFGSEDDE